MTTYTHNKIALCLSGLARAYKTGYRFLYKNLLKNNNVDIFYHTWIKPNIDFDDLYNTYNPVLYKIENTLEDVYNKKYTRIPDVKFPAYNTVSSFYSIYNCNLLKQQYEKDNNFKYDWVIRTRFDYALNAEFDFTILDKNKIHIPNCRIVPERNFGNDQFAMGSSDVIDMYCSTYLYLDEFYNAGTVMIGENMLQSNLIKHNLVDENLVYVNMNNPFPPGKLNGTWHSLIREEYEDCSPD